MNIFRYLYIRRVRKDPQKYAEYLRKTSGATIGEHCMIYSGIGGEDYLITIGNHVTLTNGVRLLTHDGGVEVLMDLGLSPRPDKFGRVTIGDNVFIGINSIVMSGVTIGDNIVIGAGSVVTKDIPSNSVAAGNPCKVLMTIEEYYAKNKDNIVQTKFMSYTEKQEYLLKCDSRHNFSDQFIDKKKEESQ